jgi:hypothetical protein
MPRLTRSELYEKLHPESTDEDQWAKTARKLLKQVIDGLEFLVVQAQAGTK